jgi:hypothetical protein
MPTYNQLRQAYGLPAKTSFTAITGESTSTFPAGIGINSPASLDFTQLRDIFGVSFALDAERDPIDSTRRSTLAARLQAIYGNVANVDAFVGMVAERHLAGTEFGELQRAIWAREFSRLRDGDRFFFGNDPGLTHIRNTYGIDFRRNLGDIIAANSDIPRAELAPNVFFVEGNVPPTSCRVNYTIVSQWQGNFQADIRITNTGSVPLDGWTLRWTFANGEEVTQVWNGEVAQDEMRVPVVPASWNRTLAANGGSQGGIGFNATRPGNTARPARFTLNTTQCSIG